MINLVCIHLKNFLIVLLLVNAKYFHLGSSYLVLAEVPILIESTNLLIKSKSLAAMIVSSTHVMINDDPCTKMQQ